MARKTRFGKCKLCGKKARLSFEHVPPRCTFNDKSVKLTNIKNGKKTLKAGKTFTIKAKPTPASTKLKVKRHRSLRFESSKPSVATVNATTGKITAKKKGSCTIYVYAQSGAFAKVRVTVKP